MPTGMPPDPALETTIPEKPLNESHELQSRDIGK